MSISKLKSAVSQRVAPRPTPVKPPPAPRPSLPSRAQPGFEPAKVKPAVIDVCVAVTKDSAIARARQLLEGGVVERKQSDGSIVIEDAAYVNDATDVKGARADEAKRQLADNVAVEADALAKLPPGDREKYLAVKKALLKSPGDPVAALALQTMLLEGKLSEPSVLGLNPTLLGGLEKLATQELAPGVDRQQLLSDVVQELAVPEAIAQRNKGTCVPTAISIQLVQENPEEYVRLISGLASPEGTVTTKGGDVLKRDDTALDDPQRALTQRLLAPALMELGNGRADYNNDEDRHYTDGVQSSGSGLTAAQADVILESLYGHDFAFQSTSSAEEKERGTEFVMNELEAGRSVLVGLKWGDGGHKVLVTGTETRDGVEYVRIVNPWGRQELIPKDDFEARLRNVNYDPNAWLRGIFS